MFTCSLFDSSIDRYHVYKVETIGDSYMVVSGLPERTEKHAVQIALLSTELLRNVFDFYVPHLPEEKLKLRIGLHTGKKYNFWYISLILTQKNMVSNFIEFIEML